MNAWAKKGQDLDPSLEVEFNLPRELVLINSHSTIMIEMMMAFTLVQENLEAVLTSLIQICDSLI